MKVSKFCLAIFGLKITDGVLASDILDQVVESQDIVRRLEVTYIDNCLGEKTCCDGSQACAGATFEATEDMCKGIMSCINAGSQGSFKPSTNSCNEEKACENAARDSGGIFEAGENSCIGYRACENAGILGGEFYAAENSCKGESACRNLKSAVIGPGSCTGTTSSCTSNWPGQVIIGAGSCTGSFNCQEMTAGLSSDDYPDIIIGDRSCNYNEEQACHSMALITRIGKDSCGGCSYSGGLTVGDSSCRGEKSCVGLNGQNRLNAKNRNSMAVIGSNSCNCQFCCACLANTINLVIPDNTCNTRGTGSEHCCTSNGDINEENESLSVNPNSIITPPTLPLSRLPAKYVLPAPVCSFDASNTALAGDFKCAFTGIISPDDASISMKVLAYDCMLQYDETQFGGTIITPSTSLVNGVAAFDAIADVNPSSGYEGDVNFCIRTDIKDVSNETMVYSSQKAKVTFSYDGLFTITGFETTPYEGISNGETIITKNFGVTAYICDASGDPISNLDDPISNPVSVSLGTNMFVCIDTVVDGTTVASILSFTATKDSVETYDILNSGSNVVIKGLESPNVKVVMIFPARFFDTSSLIKISGKVVVAPNSRRQLVNSRELQIKTQNANFELVVNVVNNDSPFLGVYYGESSASICAMMIYSIVSGFATLLFM